MCETTSDLKRNCRISILFVYAAKKRFKVSDVGFCCSYFLRDFILFFRAAVLFVQAAVCCSMSIILGAVTVINLALFGSFQL